jgi:hypothetical protein
MILLLSFSPLISILLSYNLISTSEYYRLEDPKISNSYIDIDLSIVPVIDYSALNDRWYNPKIEMLIITPDNQGFIDAVTPLMEWKNEKGVKTIILSNFSLYPGIDDAEKIRNMIKWYYKRENIRWVLLAGDAGNGVNEIPIRYVYNPDVLRWADGAHESVGGEFDKPTDFYYADLNGTWDSDGDGNWGESPTNPDNPYNPDNAYGLDEISWDPEVYVGRFPADDANELEIMVNKTIKYESNPEIGDWMNRMLLAGGISDTKYAEPPDGEDESILTTYIWQNFVISEMNFTHLWRSTYYTPPDPKEPLTSTKFRNEMNKGYSTVTFAGHGDPHKYVDVLGTIYTNIDADNILNTNNLSLIYGGACSLSSYDINDNSIGENLIKKKNAGAIGFIGGMRITYYYLDDYDLDEGNRGTTKLFWKEFFINKKFQQGRALYDSKVAYMNSDHFIKSWGSTELDTERKQLLTYCLLGDPEVDIYTNKPKFALNPFTEDIYEGQLVSATIKDSTSKVIPYARVHLKTLDGKYHTAYADVDGLVKFRVPAQANELYNVTITGHNLKPSYFNFTTLPDNNEPQLTKVAYIPTNPKTSVLTTFNIETRDNRSGIESIHLFLSKNNFTDYSHYSSSNNINENKEIFDVKTEKLTSGKYSYFIIVRDYANNTIVFQNSSYTLLIQIPLMNYISLISMIVIFGVIGVSGFLLFDGIKKYRL